eukprot:6190743-Pleurochrysis_carterae.AAC.3
MANGGPGSWNGAKRRLKRPPTQEAHASIQQEVGKIKRGRKVKAPTSTAQVMPLKKSTKKLGYESRAERHAIHNTVLCHVESQAEVLVSVRCADDQLRNECHACALVLLRACVEGGLACGCRRGREAPAHSEQEASRDRGVAGARRGGRVARRAARAEAQHARQRALADGGADAGLTKR